MQLLAFNVFKGKSVFHAGNTKPTYATPAKFLERRAISIPSGASQRSAEASAFPLPASFLNVIWDKQVTSLLCFSFVEQRMCRFHKMAWYDQWRPEQDREGAKGAPCPAQAIICNSPWSLKQQKGQHAVRKSEKRPSKELIVLGFQIKTHTHTNYSNLGAPTDTSSNVGYKQTRLSPYIWHPLLQGNTETGFNFFHIPLRFRLYTQGGKKMLSQTKWSTDEGKAATVGCRLAPKAGSTSKPWPLWTLTYLEKKSL